MNIYPFHLTFDPNLRAFLFPFIAEGSPVPGPFCYLSSIEAGDMKFVPGDQNLNRKRFFTALAEPHGLAELPVYAVEQVHSQDVVLVKEDTLFDGPPADGLLTATQGIWLSVTVADCLPIFLRDRSGAYRALLHSGWKGTGIVDRALSVFVNDWHIKPQDILAVLGPCICGDCYQVDENRARQFKAQFGTSDGAYPLGPVVRVTKDRQAEPLYYLDLQAANAHLLARAGVKNLAVCQDCTLTNLQLGSFRRQGPASYTRMVALIN